MSEEISQIVFGKLTKPFEGFKIGAKTFCIKPNPSLNFLLLLDEEDEHWGAAFTNITKPEIEIEKYVLIQAEYQTRFFTYFDLAISKIKIPKDFDFKFAYEKIENKTQ